MNELRTSDESAVVDAFANMRERCEHYNGIKDRSDDDQCKHPDNRGSFGNWCALDCCPLVRARAEARSLGWN